MTHLIDVKSTRSINGFTISLVETELFVELLLIKPTEYDSPPPPKHDGTKAFSRISFTKETSEKPLDN